MVTLQIRKLVGLLMLAPAVTLFLLYLFRPRPYVLAGVTSWAAGSVMMLVLSFDSGGPNPADSPTPSRPAACRRAWALAALVFGAGIRLCGGVVPRRRGDSARLRWGFPSPCSGRWRRPLPAVRAPWSVPAFVMMSIWQAHGAIAYLRSRGPHRMVGAAADRPRRGRHGDGQHHRARRGDRQRRHRRRVDGVAYFNFVSAALLVLGMHLLIFEDVIKSCAPPPPSSPTAATR